MINKEFCLWCFSGNLGKNCAKIAKGVERFSVESVCVFVCVSPFAFAIVESDSLGEETITQSAHEDLNDLVSFARQQ